MSAVTVLCSSFDSRGAISLLHVIALLLVFDACPNVPVCFNELVGFGVWVLPLSVS